MKNFQKFVLLLLAMVTIFSKVTGQIVTVASSANEILEKFNISDSNEPPIVSFPALTSQELKALYIQDSIADLYNESYRFAKLLETNLTSDSYGIWSTKGANRIWKVGIYGTEALSLSLTFQNLSLPLNAGLYLISGSKDLVCGPFTTDNIPLINEISTEVLQSSKLYIYYYEPLSVIPSTIHINKIGFGYRDGSGSSLNCNVDVTDNRGDCFRLEQRGVGLLLINHSTALCSCTLINSTNSNENLQPFILTGNHCTVTLGNNIDFDNLGVRFKFWKGSYQFGWVTYIGVQQLAATGTISDCSLLRLNQTPTADRGLFYLGWSRSNLAPSNSTVLHHPRGDVMKISHDAQNSNANTEALTFGTFPLPVNSAWRFSPVQEGDFGIIEGGSSGSSLLNPEHRIVGQAKGGDHYTCNNLDVNTWFPRFDLSWNTGTTSATRLRDWLDPINSNNQEQLATFQLSGSRVIPCPGLEQDIYAPSLQTNSGQLYTYTWQASQYLTLIGNGPHIKYKDNGNCTGCAGWIECIINNPTECGNLNVARSVRQNITWVNPTPATNFKNTISPSTNNNGNIIGSFNNICAFGLYTIKVGFEGIPVPSNTVFDWNYTGNIITAYPSSDGWEFAFHTDAPGIFTLNVRIVAGTGCLPGKTATYVFQVLSPCSIPQPIVLNTNIDISKNSIVLYPNPANQNISIQIPFELLLDDALISVFDVSGRLIKQFITENNFENLDTSNFMDGLYYIYIRSNKISFTEKFLVNH